eukprot:5837595-Lingulodinium_polyedra.AAC.1
MLESGGVAMVPARGQFVHASVEPQECGCHPTCSKDAREFVPFAARTVAGVGRRGPRPARI